MAKFGLGKTSDTMTKCIRALQTRLLLFSLAVRGQRICVPASLFRFGALFLIVFVLFIGVVAGAVIVDLVADGGPVLAAVAFLLYVGAVLVASINMALPGVYLIGVEVVIASLFRVHRLSKKEVVRFGMPSTYAPVPVAWLRGGKVLRLWSIIPWGTASLRQETEEALRELNRFIEDK